MYRDCRWRGTERGFMYGRRCLPTKAISDWETKQGQWTGAGARLRCGIRIGSAGKSQATRSTRRFRFLKGFEMGLPTEFFLTTLGEALSTLEKNRVITIHSVRTEARSTTTTSPRPIPRRLSRITPR